MTSEWIKSELWINHGKETRIAVIENGHLREIHIERAQHQSLIGHIFKGKVVRVLPGMQAAFVDVGLERTGFLHVSNVLPITEEALSSHHDKEANIQQWLHEGQELLVQVIKDPLGSKGARLSTHLSIPSRFLVYMPDLGHVGVSLKLENQDERRRLQDLMQEALGSKEASGYIVRTVAQGVSNQAVVEDIAYLNKLWCAIETQAKQCRAPAEIHSDLPVAKRLLRDFSGKDLARVMVDSSSMQTELQRFVDEYIPGLNLTIENYDGKTPIFDMYGIEDHLAQALKRQVNLKSGGYLVFDQTEAMTTIDINTGRFVGSRNLEETIFKTNLEAARVIAHQIRLRNIGGIVVIDFIDMRDTLHQQQVLATLESAFVRDEGRVCLGAITEFGLVQLTRKRTTRSLWHIVCEVCPQCEGRGRIKTIQTIAYEIFREIVREANLYPNAEGFLIMASAGVIDYILEVESEEVANLEGQLRKLIKLQADVNFSQEQYDLILL